ncbi:MAG: cupin domain-containing protein [Candidatus Omnitrophota bacterium]
MKQPLHIKRYKQAVKAAVFLLCVFFCSRPDACMAAEIAAETVTEELAKAQTSWDGSPLPPYPNGAPEITILRIIIPQGTRLPLHKHPVINAGVMIRGELTVITENSKVLHLKEGSAIVETVDRWHYGQNNGDGPAEIIVFYAGARGTPIKVTP